MNLNKLVKSIKKMNARRVVIFADGSGHFENTFGKLLSFQNLDELKETLGDDDTPKSPRISKITNLLAQIFYDTPATYPKVVIDYSENGRFVTGEDENTQFEFRTVEELIEKLERVANNDRLIC